MIILGVKKLFSGLFKSCFRVVQIQKLKPISWLFESLWVVQKLLRHRPPPPKKKNQYNRIDFTFCENLVFLEQFWIGATFFHQFWLKIKFPAKNDLFRQNWILGVKDLFFGLFQVILEFSRSCLGIVLASTGLLLGIFSVLTFSQNLVEKRSADPKLF